jgi:hypothetical protein
MRTQGWEKHLDQHFVIFFPTAQAFPPTFFGTEQRLSLPSFANPSQVLRKFAKKPKRILREV